VARDRQRAKQRKARRHQDGLGPDAERLQQPRHEDVPGSLEHASGEVEEFDAALISGAGGEPAPDLADADLEAEEADGARPARATAAEPTHGRSGNRFLAFLRASWAELQRVQWPDRRQVGQATAVVLGFVVIAGAYLGLADQVAKQIVDFII
jgi:preprotein translocase subunit SecE